MAYYTVFSIAPLLIIAIGIAGQVFGEKAAQGESFAMIEDTLGSAGAQAVQDMLANVHVSGQSIPATILGFVILLFGASGVFLQLQASLNTVWKVIPRPGLAITDFIRERLLSFAVVLAMGASLLASLVFTAVLAAAGRYWTTFSFPGGVIIWQAVNALVSFAFVGLLFTLIFKLLPDAKVAWHDAIVGGVVTASLFTQGKYLLFLSLATERQRPPLERQAQLVVILVWVYYSSQLILFGAEFTYVHARQRGIIAPPTEKALAV